MTVEVLPLPEAGFSFFKRVDSYIEKREARNENLSIPFLASRLIHPPLQPNGRGKINFLIVTPASVCQLGLVIVVGES